MLKSLPSFIRKYGLISPGDGIVCAVSGGTDSMALLWALYLLKERLGISLSAAHFNHHLRGEESDRDAAFVAEFCSRYEIPLYLGEGKVVPGKKGMEAAAREARYAFFKTLPGKIATAHTADDNAETVLLHLVRGTGLKGLGAIAPVHGRIIRPMLAVTRQQAEALLEEYHIPHVEDSSNGEDDFLRNRLRHRVMPLLRQENPRIGENLSAMALRLREDEAALFALVQPVNSIACLRDMPAALRSRALEKILKDFGVREPEAEHIALLEALVLSENPSARADFPGGITVTRQYDALALYQPDSFAPVALPVPGAVRIPELGLTVHCAPADAVENSGSVFTVHCGATVTVRPRQAGDALRRQGGNKSLKKRFIDQKIPAAQRNRIPVIADAQGILGVYGLGADAARQAEVLPAVKIWFTPDASGAKK